MRAGLGVALVGLVVCVGCGPPKPTQEEAVAAIEALGGMCRIDENNIVTMVNLSNPPSANKEVTDADLKHLKGLTKLESLDLRKNNITGAALVHLKGLTNLDFLILSSTKVSDKSPKQRTLHT